MKTEDAFAIVLKKERKKAKLTQEKLAERAGMHPVAISLFENGKRNPSLQSIFKVAIGLKIQPHTLIKGVADLNPDVIE